MYSVFSNIFPRTDYICAITRKSESSFIVSNTIVCAICTEACKNNKKKCKSCFKILTRQTRRYFE